MAKLNEKINLGKRGVNYVTTIVDNSNCTFNPVVQENDVGMDGIIELFTKDGTPTSVLIGVQIKTGKSYYNLNTKKCKIPIDSHRDYWNKFTLPFIGIVCIQDGGTQEIIDAYWVDIKAYLKEHPSDDKISFKMTKENRFNTEEFRNGFCNCFIFSHQVLEMSFSEAKELSSLSPYKYFGYYALMKYFSKETEAWKIVFEAYERKDPELDVCLFFDSLTYTMSHPDHWYNSTIYQFSDESRNYVLGKIKDFSEKDVDVMLNLVKEDEYQRGTLFQSIEILTSEIDDSNEKIFKAISKSTNAELIQTGTVIIALHSKEFFIKHKDFFSSNDKELTKYIMDLYSEYGEFFIY